MQYAVTLTPDELDTVRQALGYQPPTKPIRPRLITGSAQPFTPNTGDPKLDEFMRRSRAKRGAPKPAPAPKVPTFPYGLKPLGKTLRARREVERFNEAAVKAWRDRGHIVTVDPLPKARPDAPDIALDGRNVRVAFGIGPKA